MPLERNLKANKSVDRALKLPKSAQDLFDHYINLNIQGLKVVCPYHINTGLRGKSRALVGKGKPEEIEAAAEKYLAQFQMFAEGDTERLARYLMACGLGVDCSGFVAWMLNCITLDKLNKPLQNCLTFPSIKRSVVSKLRPFENISANLLTSTTNSIKITDINKVRPGDMIRMIHGGHVIIVSEVGLNKENGLVYFKYMQSTVGYGNRKGVEEDKVIITKSGGYLLDQKWPERSVYADLMKSGDDARLVRLKALNVSYPQML
jgi:hypothetical protein